MLLCGGKGKNIRGLNGRFMKVKDVSATEAIRPNATRLQGTRLVDIGHLISQSTCKKCRSDLKLSCIEDEICHGLASTWTIKCESCGLKNEVETSEKQPHGFSSNLSAVIGAWDAGIGATQLNAVLSALNLPTVSPALFLSIERKIGPEIEKLAENSCLRAISTERELSLRNHRQQECDICGEIFKEKIYLEAHMEEHMIDEHTMTNTEEKLVGISVSSDGLWYKRGNGFSYDSKGGFVSIIGKESQKVLSFKVFSSYCKLCEKGGKPCGRNICPKNWEGSAKAMESAGVVELCVENPLLSKAKVKVTSLVADGDSSVHAAIERASKSGIEKYADIRHNLKHIPNYLYPRKNKQITSQAISYLQSLAGCAIKKNIGNPDKINESLLAIPKHAMGQHESCPDWCSSSTLSAELEEISPTHSKYLDSPIDVKGSPTFEQNLKIIEVPFKNLAKRSAQLAPNGSTQTNESLNNTVISKCSKRLFHSGSKSALYRSAAGVLQKNEGVTYVLSLQKLAGVKVSSLSAKYRTQLALKRKYQAEYKRDPVAKKRRKFLQNKRKANRARAEKKEGPSYESGLVFKNKKLPLIEKKKVFSRPSLRRFVKQVDTPKMPPTVFFDLETTGFGAKFHDIIQLAAVTDDGTILEIYVNPSRAKIPEKVTTLTGISKKRGKMLKHGQAVASCSIEEAIHRFLQFLKLLDQPAMLIAHNASFDMLFLLENLRRCGRIEEFMGLTVGFADTLAAAKKYAKDSPRHDIASLCTYLFGAVPENLHCAVSDVKALMQITKAIMKKTEDILEFSYCLDDYVFYQKLCTSGVSLQPLLCVNKVSSRHLTMIASAGYDINSIRLEAGKPLEAFLSSMKSTKLETSMLTELYHFCQH